MKLVGWISFWAIWALGVQHFLNEEPTTPEPSSIRLVAYWDPVTEVNGYRVYSRHEHEARWSVVDVTETYWWHDYTPGVWSVAVQARRGEQFSGLSNVVSFMVGRDGSFRTGDFEVKLKQPTALNLRRAVPLDYVEKNQP